MYGKYQHKYVGKITLESNLTIPIPRRLNYYRVGNISGVVVILKVVVAAQSEKITKVGWCINNGNNRRERIETTEIVGQ